MRCALLFFFAAYLLLSGLPRLSSADSAEQIARQTQDSSALASEPFDDDDDDYRSAAFDAPGFYPEPPETPVSVSPGVARSPATGSCSKAEAKLYTLKRALLI